MYLFKYKINKIIVYPFGGIIDFVNKPDYLYRYFLISFGGILANLLLVLFAMVFKINVLIQINLLFIFFNLIPIYPLDGAKMLLCFFKIFTPFYFCKKIIYYFSIGLSVCLLLICFYFYNAYIILFFIFVFIYLNYFSLRNFNIEYHNFLLVRHINPNKSLKTKTITRFNDPINSVYYGFNMIFDFDAFVLKEEEMLDKYFKAKNESL